MACRWRVRPWLRPPRRPRSPAKPRCRHRGSRATRVSPMGHMRTVRQASTCFECCRDSCFGLIGRHADVDVGPATPRLGRAEALERHVRVTSVPIDDVFFRSKAPVPEGCGPKRTYVAARILCHGSHRRRDLLRGPQRAGRAEGPAGHHAHAWGGPTRQASAARARAPPPGCRRLSPTSVPPTRPTSRRSAPSLESAQRSSRTKPLDVGVDCTATRGAAGWRGRIEPSISATSPAQAARSSQAAT